VDAVEAPDPYTVVFRLKRPQPGLLVMLASGYSPIYAAHVNPATYRTGCVGTGPFKLKSWQTGDRIVLERNNDYWNTGHPFLDEAVIRPLPDAGARFASLVAGDVDIVWDDNGNIGKRYRRQDEVGTPFCVTVDFDTLENNTVTVRHRDTGEQERVEIEELPDFLKARIESGVVDR